MRRALACWRTVIGVHAVLLGVATLLALPAWGTLWGSLGNVPDADLALGHLAGVFVADIVRNDVRALVAAARAVLFGAAAFAFFSVPLSAGLFGVLSDGRDQGAGRFAQHAAGGAGPFFVLWVTFGVGAAVVVAAAAAVVRDVAAGFADAPDPAVGWLWAALSALPFAVVLVLLSAATDVARAAVARGDRSALGAYWAAVRTCAQHPFLVAAPYVAFCTTAAALTLVTAALGLRFGGRPGAAPVGLLVLGQAVLLLRAFLRAAWIGTAARLSGALLPPRRPGLPVRGLDPLPPAS